MDAFDAVDGEAAGYAQGALLLVGLEGPGLQFGGGDALVLGQVAQYAGLGVLGQVSGGGAEHAAFAAQCGGD